MKSGVGSVDNNVSEQLWAHVPYRYLTLRGGHDLCTETSLEAILKFLQHHFILLYPECIASLSGSGRNSVGFESRCFEVYKQTF